jgi:hypothetical protein
LANTTAAGTSGTVPTAITGQSRHSTVNTLVGDRMAVTPRVVT